MPLSLTNKLTDFRKRWQKPPELRLKRACAELKPRPVVCQIRDLSGPGIAVPLLKAQSQ